MRERSASLSTSLTTVAALDSPLRVGGADALGQAGGVQRQQVPHLVLAQDLRQRGHVGRRAMPENKLLPIILQQQL